MKTGMFFYKQKTAYEMRIRNRSADMCSSDLAGGGEDPLALDLDQAGAAVAVGAVAGLRRMAEMGNLRPIARRGRPDGLVGLRLDVLPVQREADDFRLGDCNHYFSSSRSEEHTSELQSLMRISYAVFCLKKKNKR